MRFELKPIDVGLIKNEPAPDATHQPSETNVVPEDAFASLESVGKALGILRGMHVFRRTGDEGSVTEVLVTQARRVCPRKIAVFAGFNAVGVHPNPELMGVERLNMQAFRFLLRPQRIVNTPELTLDRPIGSTKPWALSDKGPFLYLHNSNILDVRNWSPGKLILPSGPALHVPPRTDEAYEAEFLAERIAQFSAVDEIDTFCMLPQITVQ